MSSSIKRMVAPDAPVVKTVNFAFLYDSKARHIIFRKRKTNEVFSTHNDRGQIYIYPMFEDGQFGSPLPLPTDVGELFDILNLRDLKFAR